jgi:hypothetical protein
VTADPFPGSLPLSDLIDDAEPAWPVLPDGPVAWTVCFSRACVLARMPDGNLAEGTGESIDDATADARRNWRRWKRAHPGPLAVDGREYRRRTRNRRRR